MGEEIALLLRCSPAVENIVDEQIKFGFKGEINLAYQEKEVVSSYC